MLSAIKVIGACLIILVTVFGLIAISLTLLIHTKRRLTAFKEYGFPRNATGNGFRALMADAKARPGRFLLVVGIGCVCLYFAEYVLLGLIALGLIAAALVTIEKWRGHGFEERLTRHLSRPLFVDESRRSTSSHGG